jgi:hypothetical protein
VTQVRAGSLQQQQRRRRRRRRRGQNARRCNARRGLGGGPRNADQAARSTWIRSRVIDRLANVQHSNVAEFYRKCAWGNVVEDSCGDFFDISSSQFFFVLFLAKKKKKKKITQTFFFSIPDPRGLIRGVARPGFASELNRVVPWPVAFFF